MVNPGVISYLGTTLSSKLKATRSLPETAASANQDAQFLTISPVLPVLPKKNTIHKLSKRSSSSSSSRNPIGHASNEHGCNTVTLQQTEQGSSLVVVSRSSLERERNPDRICLDRRGLTIFPSVENEPKLRLLSLQHNLISSVEKDQMLQFAKLVFLDLYDNQIDKLAGFESLQNLRVLLMGKNRIKKIDGLRKLTKLEILDLHGNQIVQVSGLEESKLLKVLNLAGNNIKNIGHNDFRGLACLKELNLRRNKIKKLLGFENMPQLQKLYISNNDIKKIEDIGSIAKALQIREITIDGNPVTLTPDCTSFLASYLPNLQVISAMQVNEQIRRTAMAWRTLKEQSNSAFLDLSTQICVNVRREEIISNAKSNWELLRSRTKYLGNTNKALRNGSKDLTCQSQAINVKSKPDLNRYKSKDFESLMKQGKDSFETKKSKSTENLFKLGNNYSLEFKLPPILLPIIDNLTSDRIPVISQNNARSEKSSDSSDSESDSVESHASLKSGLRNHLKFSGRAMSLDIDSIVKTSKNNENVFHGTSMEEITPLGDCRRKSNSWSWVNRAVARDSSESNGSSAILDKNARAASARLNKMVHYRSNRAATARVKYTSAGSGSPSSQPAVASREREEGGDYLVEIAGRCLNIYGQGALRFIDKQWDSMKASEINLVKFNYVQFNGVAAVMSKLKHRFPNAEHFLFKETNISHLGQLDALAETKGLVSLQIEAEGNPIVSKKWKTYAIFRLAHWGLQVINGTLITQEIVHAANREYSGLLDMVLWSLPETFCDNLIHRYRLEQFARQNGEQVPAKQFLFNGDPTLKEVVAKEALEWKRGHATQDGLLSRHRGKIYFTHLIEQTIQAIAKLQILNTQWPIILEELVYNILMDYSNVCDYMERSMKDLESR